MDTKVFKRLIKEAVKEAMQEELKEVLIQAMSAQRAPMQESYVPPTVTPTPLPSSMNPRERYRQLLGDMMDARNGNLSMTANEALGFGAQAGYRPPSTVNTTTEGSALPAGEVNLNQIMGLINKK